MVSQGWAVKKTVFPPNSEPLHYYACTACGQKVTSVVRSPSIGHAFQKDTGKHHWQACTMPLIGGETTENLLRRDEICKTETLHMAMNKMKRPQMRLEPTEDRKGKRRASSSAVAGPSMKKAKRAAVAAHVVRVPPSAEDVIVCPCQVCFFIVAISSCAKILFHRMQPKKASW